MLFKQQKYRRGAISVNTWKSWQFEEYIHVFLMMFDVVLEWQLCFAEVCIVVFIRAVKLMH